MSKGRSSRSYSGSYESDCELAQAYIKATENYTPSGKSLDSWGSDDPTDDTNKMEH